MAADLDRLEGGGAGGERGGIGAMLREARQKTGVDLRDVAEALRIQYAYLEAIEEGRYGDLPGSTYALGFVRAYAEYLNLDIQEVVRLFKAEARGLSQRQALIFPEPLQEGRFPGGTLLVAALVVAASVYGVWYFWQQRQVAQVEAIPPVPPNILSQTTPGRAVRPAGSSAQAPPAPSTSTPSEAQASSITANNFNATASDSGATGTAPSGASPVTASDTPASAGPPNVPAETSAAVPTPAPKPAEFTAPPSATAAAPAAESTESGNTPSAPSSENSAASIPSVPEQIASVKPSEPHVYGENNANSRITLAAKEDSWVQVRDNDGNVIWTRILRAGDSYRVPNRSGLTLLTGNAGALEVRVDGKAAPPLGAEGAVRRNIVLDPEKLAAGKAGSQ